MTIVIAILGIGFLIFFHELGHYLACRLTKTRTETFSVGFGPRLFGWERRPGERARLTTGARRLDPTENAMDFRVSMIPLGGYVKMAGENPGESTGRSDEFAAKPTMSRVFIVSAGVIMNAIAAFLLYAVAYGSGMKSPPSTVGGIQTGGAAWQAGLVSGDRITSVNGQPVRTFMELQMETVLLPRDERSPVTFRRDGTESSAQVVPVYDVDRGALFFGIDVPQRLDLRVDDRKLSIGPGERATVAGAAVTGATETVEALESALAAGIDPVAVVKGEETVSIALRDRKVEPPGPKDEWKIGVEAWGHPVVRAVRGSAEGKLQPGDEVLSATLGDGTERTIEASSAWRALRHAAGLRSLAVQRKQERVTVEVGAATPEAALAFLRDVHAVVTPTARVQPNDPLRRNVVDGADPDRGRERWGIAQYERSDVASAAGIRSGDLVFKIGTSTIESFSDIPKVLAGLTSGKDLDVWVKGPDNVERKVTLEPTRLARYEGIDYSLEVLQEVVVPEGFAAALPVALKRTGREVLNVFRTIGSFFAGSISFNKNIGGPVQLVKLSASATESSWQMFLAFLAYISVTLAVLNILPVPVLDGGHLLFILLEKIKGAPLKPATIAKFQMVGLVLILLLLGFALKNDFTSIFKRS